MPLSFFPGVRGCLALALSTLFVSGLCGRPAAALDPLAEGYVKLALAIGQHAEDYVDSYYGPAEWRAAAQAAGPRPLVELAAESARLRAALQAQEEAPGDGAAAARAEYLSGLLSSAHAYLELLQGRKLSFDEEAKALYGVEPPRVPLADYEGIRDRLEALLPGSGPITPRYLEWRKQFEVPLAKLEEVMRVAIAESRRRTLQHVALPANEAFTLALVTDKPWAAYNWYRGDAVSLIEVNVTSPVYLSQILTYAAHEGYPGHHVYNVLQEAKLARAEGRVEHTIMPLFSPLALLAEGTAEAGIEVAFPGAERAAFEREVLFPLAGLPVDRAEQYAEVAGLVKTLAEARVQLAREYLQGTMSGQQVVDWLIEYGLRLPEEAERSVRFFDTYRSYIVNYSVGERMVLDWLEARAGHDHAARWAALIELLSTPRLPASLVERPAR